jgi:hypothetical protein
VDRVHRRITGTRYHCFCCRYLGGIESRLWTERGLPFILPNTAGAIYEAH